MGDPADEDRPRLVSVGTTLAALLLLVGGFFAVTWGVQFVQDVPLEMGNVTVQERRSDGGYVVTVRVDDVEDADYLNVVVNGNTDNPRVGVRVREPNVTTAPWRGGQTGSGSFYDDGPGGSRDGPLEGPPDADADSTGDVVRVTGLESGDTVEVVAVDTTGTAEGGYDSVTAVRIASHTVGED